ncbi:hypothetical protein CPB85DRAFT_1447114 [Mucidula mucida]|nr:hypothetical protein CPB85DRAFT_1447114 [Mucidula mucida]
MSPQPGFGVQLPNLHFCRICVYDTFNNAYDLEGRRCLPRHSDTTKQRTPVLATPSPSRPQSGNLGVSRKADAMASSQTWCLDVEKIRSQNSQKKQAVIRGRRIGSYCLTAKYVVKLKVEHPGSEYAEGILVRPREEGTCWYKRRYWDKKPSSVECPLVVCSQHRDGKDHYRRRISRLERSRNVIMQHKWRRLSSPDRLFSRDKIRLFFISRCSTAFWYTTRFNSFGMYMRICRLRESWQSVNILRPADLERSDTTSAIALAGQAFGLGRRQVRRSLGLNTACTRAVSLRIADPDLDLTTFRVAVVFGPCYGELGPGPFAERGTQQRRRDRLVTVWTLPLESVDNWNKGTPHFDFDDMPVHGDGVNGAPSAIQSLLKPKTFALAKARDIPKVRSRGGDGAGASLSPRLTPSAIYSTTKGKQTYSAQYIGSSDQRLNAAASALRAPHCCLTIKSGYHYATGTTDLASPSPRDFADWANGNLFKPDNDGHYLKAPTALTTAQQDEYSDLGGTLRHILILGPAELWEEVGSGVLKRPPILRTSPLCARALAGSSD